jgi:hypothetical protein
VLSEHGLKIAPSTYYAAKSRPPSPRTVRDETLKIEIKRVYEENLFVYGRQDLDCAQPGRHPSGPVHGRAAHG